MFIFRRASSELHALSPVCVYVNKHGDCGPLLDRKLMQQLPDHFGPGPVNVVLQQAVQACVGCSCQPKALFSFLQAQSDGGEVIKGSRAVKIGLSGGAWGRFRQQYFI